MWKCYSLKYVLFKFILFTFHHTMYPALNVLKFQIDIVEYDIGIWGIQTLNKEEEEKIVYLKYID